jgi:adenosylhomocysteine nucleosidase
MKNLFIAALKQETEGMPFFHHIGVGKINATFNTLKLIDKFKPDLIINFGTAGAKKKGLSGLIECTRFYQRDMDVRSLNFKLGETPFDDINEILISDGYSCGSGDNFVHKEIEMQVDVVDMEAYAIAKVCKKKAIKFKCFKYISDNADSNSSTDWKENLKKGSNLFYGFAKKNNLIK